MSNTYTANLNLAKPAKGDADWDDEINGNADALDVAVGTEHRTDGAHKNTIRIGDGANSIDKVIIARTGEPDEPYIMYDVSANRFVMSNDGTDEAAIMTASPNVFEVAPSGKPYTTIIGALADASAGDMIIIYPGTYTLSAPLTVSRAVKIIGNGNPLIEFNAGSGQYVVNVTAAATLKGLNISMTGALGGGVLKIASSNVIIEDCCIDNNGAGGCGVKCDSGSSIVKNCTIETGYGSGVSIDGGTHIFRDCAITSVSYGVTLSDTAALTATFVACEIIAGGSSSAIHLYDTTYKHTIICRRCVLKKGATATYTVTESASGSSGRIYHCALDAAVNITNDISTPYNVVDSDV